MLLLAGVAVMVGVIGVGSAWAVTAWDFPGRKILSWALLLPLAMPTYIVAFAWLDLLHPIGPPANLFYPFYWVLTAQDSSVCQIYAHFPAQSSYSDWCFTHTCI